MKLKAKHLLAIVLPLLIFSCSRNTKLIYTSRTKNVEMRFYSATSETITNPFYVFAIVDSNHSKTKYFFKDHKIYKIMQQNKSLIYTLEYKEPEIPFSTSDYFLRLLPIDLSVFKKADYVLDSLQLTKLKRPIGATGFIIEIAGH